MSGNPTALVLKRFYLVAAVIILLLVLSGCSVPRIIILNDPLSAEEHNKLGSIYESQGKFDLAAQQYREALRKEPKFLASLLLLGDLSFRTGNYADAEASYKKAIKLQPENGDTYNNLCWVYLEQRTGMEKAEDLIKKALSLTPEHRAYYLDTWGVVLLRKGKYTESIAALRESIELLPKDNNALLAEAYGHLAEAYRAAGDTDRALDAERIRRLSNGTMNSRDAAQETAGRNARCQNGGNSQNRGGGR